MDNGGAGGPSRRAHQSTRGTVTVMGSGMTFRKLGVAVVATAFTALVGITAASAATTSTMTSTTQGGAAGTGNAGADTSKSGQCEARAQKRHLTGDQHDSYVKRCMTEANTHHKKTTHKASAAPAHEATGTQAQPGGATSSQ
jgi:hypothetical protein